MSRDCDTRGLPYDLRLVCARYMTAGPITQLGYLLLSVDYIKMNRNDFQVVQTI